MESKTKYKIGIVILIVIVIALIASLLISIYFMIEQSKVKGDFNSAIPAVISSEKAVFKIDKENIELSKNERVSILKDDYINNEYLVKYNDKIGTIEKNNISYYKFDENDRYSLMLDVSRFNIAEKGKEGDSSKNFQNEKDFEQFILKNNIQYVYIRLGGRGWGQSGTLYYDDDAVRYMESCEYLKVPYGFYFIEEAVNEEELKEEVKYVKDFLDKNKTSMNVLPIAIDMEYQHGQGRTDNIWDTRVTLLNKMIEEFNKINEKCILYANGARIEKYLKTANCKFWTAMYPQNGIIPENNYKATVKLEQLQNQLNELTAIASSNLTTKVNQGGTDTVYYSDEFLDKVIGWQFTESGAKKDGIEDAIDLSLVDNRFFKEFVK